MERPSFLRSVRGAMAIFAFVVALPAFAITREDVQRQIAALERQRLDVVERGERIAGDSGMDQDQKIELLEEIEREAEGIRNRRKELVRNMEQLPSEAPVHPNPDPHPVAAPPRNFIFDAVVRGGMVVIVLAVIGAGISYLAHRMGWISQGAPANHSHAAEPTIGRPMEIPVRRPAVRTPPPQYSRTGGVPSDGEVPSHLL